ncbi:MAG: JAB domain-containing protein [Lachnospiraceae bacterium]|uniref:JAB domain-containing protein n=1 Tax=Mediterraneibacter gnavus TaxID=33038 RepID=UPI002906B822|nr:JAB domain-containing protein [Lachnospiraceae bacterium]
MFRNSERNRSRYGETIKTHEKKTYQVIDSNGDVWTDGSMGTINASLVTGREVFKSAILSNASYVILLHNHPSGDPQPSHHDFLVTSKLCAGGNILGIDVLDHIIVGGRTGKYHSMAKEGELENLRTKLLESAKAVAEPLFQRGGKEKHRIRRI